MSARAASRAIVVLAACLFASSVGAEELVLGVMVERTLGPGEHHSYELPDASSANPVLRVTAEQEGVDLALVRLAADGSEVTRVDSPMGRRGRECLLIEAPSVAGERIEVRALERRAPRGRYRLELDRLPLDTAADRRRLAAERLELRAAEAYAGGDPEGKRQALAAHREARVIWRELGEPAEEARSLAALGLFQRLTGAASEALESYRQAFEIRRGRGETGEIAWLLNEIGVTRAHLGDRAGAFAAYDEATDLWRALGDEGSLGRTLNNKGLVHHTGGDPRAARPFYEAAQPLLEGAGYPTLAATVLNNLAAVAAAIGEPEAALATFDRVISTQRELGNPREQARAEGNRADLFRLLGRLQEALEGHHRALEIQRALAEPGDAARTLSNLGELYLSLGEPERARGLIEESLSLRQEAGDRRGEAYSLHNLGAAQRARGELAAARASFERAILLFREMGERRGEANTLRVLGEALAAAGQDLPARARLEEALAVQTELDDRRGRGETLRRWADLELAAGEADAARLHFTLARDLARETRHPLLEIEALVGRARSGRALNLRAEAEGDATEALETLERVRATLATPELRASFLALRSGATELAVALAWDAHRRDPAGGHDRRAFELAHGARARSLAEAIEESAGRAAVAPDLAARRRAAAERLSLKALRLGERLNSNAPPVGERLNSNAPPVGERLARNRRDAETTALERDERAALAELEALDAEISRALPRLADWNGPRATPVAEVQALLDPGTLLLVYVLGSERSLLFALTGRSFAGYELAPGERLEADAQELHERWRSLEAGAPRGADQPSAAAVGRQLLAPAATEIATAHRLVVIPDGALGLLPFAALPDPGSRVPLVERVVVSVVPSANVLAALRARRGARARGTKPTEVLIVADPVFDERDPRAVGKPGEAVVSKVPADSGRLPWSGAEAAAVAAAWRATKVRLAVGFEARLEVLTAEPLDRYRILHFATHGVVDLAHPERTGLRFAGLDAAGRRRPGFLGLPEVHGLGLAADLVVLSGCRTALGREVRNEGPVGLARGFLYAGADRVLASLWPVEDRATAELMTHFYRSLASGERTPAEALALAQRTLRAQPRWSDPYYWSGFVLHGDGN